jgi:hypothetical protein
MHRRDDGNFFDLPRELRDLVYHEVFRTDEPLDAMVLIKANGACPEVR